jgi:protein O-GlcNAc transferase
MACAAGMTVLGSFLPLRGQGTNANAAETVYRAGQAAYAHGDFAAAESDFRQFIRLVPRAEPGHSSLGATLLAEGRAKDAVHELEVALSIQKGDENAQRNLAVAYQLAGEPAKSLPLFAQTEAAAKAKGQVQPASVLSSYARALAATGKLPQAEAQMKAAVESAPDDAELHDALGSLEAQQEHWVAAQAEFARAVQRRPEMASAHLHLGLAMEAQGNSAGLQELVQAESLAPENPTVGLELGKAYAAAGQDDRAIPLFQHALTLQPGSTETMYQLALSEQRAGQLPDAIALLRKVSAAEPENADVLTNLGMALAQAQKAKDALPVLQRAVALAPKDATAHQDLAAAYVQLSQFGDAATELRLALKLSPNSPQLHYNLGVALKMQDDAADAISELEAAERLDASASEPPYLLGILYMQAARYPEAARELKRSLDLRPANGDAWATLGSVYSKLDKLPEATAALREAIKQLPDEADAHLTLAAVLVKQNQTGEATVERRVAAELMRNHMNLQRAEVATNAGNSLLKAGDLAGATVQFKDALSYDAGYAAAHEGLAHVYESQGDAAAAAAERQKAASGVAMGPKGSSSN